VRSVVVENIIKGGTPSSPFRADLKENPGEWANYKNTSGRFWEHHRATTLDI